MVENSAHAASSKKVWVPPTESVRGGKNERARLSVSYWYVSSDGKDQGTEPISAGLKKRLYRDESAI